MIHEVVGAFSPREGSLDHFTLSYEALSISKSVNNGYLPGSTKELFCFQKGYTKGSRCLLVRSYV